MPAQKLQLGPMGKIIEEYNQGNKTLTLLYIFNNIAEIPLPDGLQLSIDDTLLQLYQHLWLEVIKLGIQMKFSAGELTDIKGVSIVLDELYYLDWMEPLNAIIPKGWATLAPYTDDDFYQSNKKMYTYTQIRVRYRAASLDPTPSPPNYQQVQSSSWNWFVPPTNLWDLSDESMVIAEEDTNTPETYDPRLYFYVHPAFIFFGLPYDVALQFGTVSPPCDYYDHTTYQWYQIEDLDAFFRDEMAQYLLSEYESQNDMPAAFYQLRELSWNVDCHYDPYSTHITDFMTDTERATLYRIASLYTYGRYRGDSEMYSYFLGQTEEQLSNPQIPVGYLVLTDAAIDVISGRSVYSEWLSSGGNSTPYQHTINNDYMIIDRLSYMLVDMMQNPACTAEGGDSPTFSIQRYAQYGIIYLLGKKIPDEYKIYRGDPIPPAGGGLQPFLPSLILINAGLSDWGINLDFRKTNSQFGKESMVYGGETMTYNGETMSYD